MFVINFTALTLSPFPDYRRLRGSQQRRHEPRAFRQQSLRHPQPGSLLGEVRFGGGPEVGSTPPVEPRPRDGVLQEEPVR